jgi:crotonobetaine/carnitine-CoA ligase
VRSAEPWALNVGYHKMPEQTAAAWRNGWFHTGDAFRRDADGWFYFVDRLRDTIRRRGENISSFEVETMVAEHPAVRECAAIGVPSGYESDDDIKLVVALQPGHAWLPNDLLEHLVRLLPHYMVPRYLQRIEALPRTPTNKVMKSQLRAAVGECWDRKAAGVALRDVARRIGTTAPGAPPSKEST